MSQAEVTRIHHQEFAPEFVFGAKSDPVGGPGRRDRGWKPIGYHFEEPRRDAPIEQVLFHAAAYGDDLEISFEREV